MKMMLISFTERGEKLSENIKLALQGEADSICTIQPPFVKKLSSYVKDGFEQMDALVFIGAAGIAVRSIAPFLRSKLTDPAVVVMDDNGENCISLLSGHFGGANELAVRISKIIGARAIITTATDVNQCFAIDMFVKKNQLFCEPVSVCKEISSALLHNQMVYLESEFAIAGKLPPYVVWEKPGVENGNPKIKFVHFHFEQEAHILYIIPKTIVIGIGCRKGIACEKIEIAVRKALLQLGADEKQSLDSMLHCVKNIASIDLKREEDGLLEFSEKYNIPFFTYDTEELKTLKGEFSHSDFVQNVTGVDNVCERAAIASCNMGKLRLKKQACDGVTIAIAELDWRVPFE